MALHLTPRDSGAITVVDASGRITLGDGSANLRKTIRQLVEEAHCKIVLNLADVDYIDSSGIGELVSAYTAVRSKGGELKLLHLTKKFTTFCKSQNSSPSSRSIPTKAWPSGVSSDVSELLPSGLPARFVPAYARVGKHQGSMPAL